ncbi:norbelladine synthase-like isoform X1 [Populus nigra]|uniref:norbelladine synthase-like isoform X1 n=1 Tax=Populus nigra TaxID=3691 RepID=UPI002B276CDA|nr:norbelladine synthase-like isoform X1 [Populus nigra]
MKDELSEETLVQAPASAVWSAYRGLELGRLTDKLLGHVVGKVEVIEGDGGVGTIVKLTFPVSMILSGTSGGFMKEIFRIMDDEKRVKETEVIEGGYIDLGFDVYRIRLEIIEKDAESTIIRSTVKYEFDDIKTELASLVTVKPLQTMAEEIGKYVSEKKYDA